jgi:HNH endonuclease
VTAAEHSEQCPYSDPPFEQFTDDHIFPQFLGGRATIRVCRECNSRFGHSFEGESARQIKQLQVFISHFGLDLTRSPATWPSALTVADRTYDLKSGPSGVQYELARPIIRRDDSGNIVSGVARSRQEANRLARDLVAKGKAKSVEIQQSEGEILNDVKLDTSVSFNPGLYRFATKLAANAASLMRRQEIIRGSGIPNYLLGKGEWGNGVGYCDTSSLRKLRPPLSHTIYIEFGAQSYAIVLIFGGWQIYVPLPIASPGAVLGFLDPISGEEFFKEVAPIGAAPPPPFISRQRAEGFLNEMLRWLSEEARERGATRPPNLQQLGIDLGRPSFAPQWEDGTYRFMKKIT